MPINISSHRKEFLVALAVAVFTMMGFAIKSLVVYNRNEWWGYFFATVFLFGIWLYVANTEKQEKKHKDDDAINLISIDELRAKVDYWKTGCVASFAAVFPLGAVGYALLQNCFNIWHIILFILIPLLLMLFVYYISNKYYYKRHCQLIDAIRKQNK